MTRKRILLADGRPVRSARLAARLGAEDSFDVLPPVRTLTDAYNLTEAQQPDVIAVCADMAQRPEFAMFHDMLSALGLRCLTYGERPPGPAAGGACTESSQLEFTEVDDSLSSGDALIGALLRTTRPAQFATHTRPRAQTPAPARAARASLPQPPAAPIATRRAPAHPQARPTLPAAPLPLVAIGASTGGVEALQTVLAAYPAECPPTVIVQHIRPDFAESVARRLDRCCAALVTEAYEGAPLAPGRVYIAPGSNLHLEVRGRQAPRCHLAAGPPVSGHVPSVDALFRSVAALGPRAVGVLLTGMGRDGAEGLLEIRNAGGETIVQDRTTCTVHGMPRAAAELGAAMLELPIQRIGAAILNACSERGTGARERSGT